ncbi:TlpA disulfide reductase family protein [Flavivirga amylovorans]|uniref:TlpA disulfide reductase family protein n=1 Tax=Flavivirga amylovorans TaxID=870486 RepID=A0ABT8WVV3_9FLAO|nr:TlpA disulfide reductase family protein [Flavivirga amylovorans]MDO5985814.1 TlpA disulfide reductase family protein [Flavivirga amylovorans]
MNISVFRLKIVAVLYIISSVALTGCKKELKHDGYTINGNVKGLDNGWVKLVETQGTRTSPKTLDSTEIVNGHFAFKGKVEVSDMVNLQINKKSTRFMLENSNITIEIDWSTVKPNDWEFTPEISGSKTHDEYSKMQEKAQTVLNDPKYTKLESLRDAYAKAKKSNDSKLLEEAMSLQKELAPLFEERNAKYVKVKHDYAISNPNSPVAVHVLGYQYTEGRMSKDELKTFYNLFSGDAKETAFYKGHMTKVYKDIFENLGVGNKAPDFTLNTIDGKPLALADVKAKYRLIDFWASWCVPCRKSFPHLKELRKKYGADNFEIVGVGTADIEDKWKKAIEEDKIPWIKLFDASPSKKGRAHYGPVAKNYGVPFLPTTFLVDENQTILLRNPTKEELDAKLVELLVK